MEIWLLLDFFTTASLEFFFFKSGQLSAVSWLSSFFTVVLSLILVVLMMPEGSRGDQGRTPLSGCVQVLVTRQERIQGHDREIQQSKQTY